MKRKPLELVVLQGGGRGARHTLSAPHVVLGRLDPYESPSSSNLLFPEPTVSRVHATLDWDDAANRYLLTHRSATNATLINKAKVTKPRHIAPGDKIQMGNLIVEIRVGVGQHAEVELETVDFTALTKQAANQVYRPESVMPDPPALPVASPQPPQEAPIPSPIPPPARRQFVTPIFHEPYAPVEVSAPSTLPVPEPSFLDFPEADEQVSVVQEAPRRIQLGGFPLPDERTEPASDSRATDVLPRGLFPTAGNAATVEPIRLVELQGFEPDLRAEDGPSLKQAEATATPIEEAPTLGQAPLESEDSPVDDSSTASIEVASANRESDPPREEESGLPEAESAGEEKALADEPIETETKPKPFKRESRKIGRNEPCPCGSGKKYKKCCGK